MATNEETRFEKQTHSKVTITEVNMSATPVPLAMGREPSSHGLLTIDLSIAPGGFVAIPRVGETWWVSRFSGRWTLYAKENALAEPKPLIYTSKPTISTEPGTPFFPTFSGQEVSIRANVTKPSTLIAVQVDVLFNGKSIFTDGKYATIPAGEYKGFNNPTGASFSPDTMMQIHAKEIADATGPMIVAIHYRPA